jgi:hypothetical protein
MTTAIRMGVGSHGAWKNTGESPRRPAVGTLTTPPPGRAGVFTTDELAGVVDLFGALRWSELETALSELAYRRGGEPPAGLIDGALEAFVLVAFEGETGEELLAPGPAAFPTLPEGAEDLPHILDVEERSVDRERVGRAAEERLRAAAARAVADGDADRAAELLDVSYDLESWAPIDLAGLRDRLDDARDETN